MSGRSTEIEIIGMISTTLASEIYGKSIITGAVDPRFIAEFARVHEDGGFDRVLVGYGSTGADGFVVWAHASRSTSSPAAATSSSSATEISSTTMRGIGAPTSISRSCAGRGRASAR